MFNFGIAEVVEQFAWFTCGCTVGTEGRYATAEQCVEGHRFHYSDDEEVTYKK